MKTSIKKQNENQNGNGKGNRELSENENGSQSKSQSQSKSPFKARYKIYYFNGEFKVYLKGSYSSIKRARSKKEKLDLEYGAYRYHIQEVLKND